MKIRIIKCEKGYYYWKMEPICILLGTYDFDTNKYTPCMGGLDIETGVYTPNKFFRYFR